MIRRCALVVSLLLTGSGCDKGSTAPDFGRDADSRVLFIGNSLTYTHDVPRLVRLLGGKEGRAVATVSIVQPNFSLEDHWHNGAPAEIRRLRADVVVLQQGPSSLPANQAHLAHWAEQFAGVIRESGGEPALYMVWPDASRRSAFADVEASYASAAQHVGGILLPAGTTWLEAWEEDPLLPLYGPDGFHPSYTGALAAALTMYAALYDVEPATLPALDDALPPERLALLRRAVGASLARWRAVPASQQP